MFQRFDLFLGFFIFLSNPSAKSVLFLQSPKIITSLIFFQTLVWGGSVEPKKRCKSNIF